MICKYYGQVFSAEYLKSLIRQRKDGVSLFEIAEAAESLGFQSLASRLTLEQLIEKAPLPAIVFWDNSHYVVLYKVTKKHFYIADPAQGKRRLSIEEFKSDFLKIKEDGQSLGVCLMLQPTQEFGKGSDQIKKESFGWAYLYNYFSQNKALLFQLFLGLLFTLVLQFVFPFLIMGVVDQGISVRDFDFVLIVLAAWSVLYFSQVLIEYLRSKIFLHIGIRTNLRIVSDFLLKIFKLPLSFFDQRSGIDILRRVYDTERLERFLTTSYLPSIFSALSVILSSLILLYFDTLVFGLFTFGILVYFIWMYVYAKARQEVGHRKFDKELESQKKLEEIINGMQDIKLNNAETVKRWDWERSEAGLYKEGIQFLKLDQRMQLGGRVISEIQNILITCFASLAVIRGEISLGALFAIQYLLGQSKEPIRSLLDLFLVSQEAKLSLDRLGEIYQLPVEENIAEKFKYIPEIGNLSTSSVSFDYQYATGEESCLKDLSLQIKRGEFTAIVGSSGSGKSTLLKLLLGIYSPDKGQVTIGDTSLQSFSGKSWRSKCAALLQDSYIFSDSIAENIALSDAYIDEKKLLNAAKVANIHRFIESLPMGFHTPVGEHGIGLSEGQKQRILLARAVYKDADFYFLDEATNGLDVYNEMIVMDNLKEFLEGKTAVMVTHRLSTVLHADRVIVLEKGEWVESGKVEELMERKGVFYQLFNNHSQLEDYGG